MRGLLFVGFLMIFQKGYCEREINGRGYWIGEVSEWHVTDHNLARAMNAFLRNENASSVVDFGCGEGDYVRCFLEHGFDCVGYDGNPDTPTLTKGVGQVLDLSEPFDLERTFDWVVCLEVGEHIPHQYEKTFIENLMRHTKKGIILSWALKNQPGAGHFNCQNNDYIKAIFARCGYTNDLEIEKTLRESASISWFKNTLMVFRSAI